jgi:hypothetical protein
MECELCRYWLWRLADARKSWDKATDAKRAAQLHGCAHRDSEAYFDFTRVSAALRAHREQHATEAG